MCCCSTRFLSKEEEARETHAFFFYYDKSLKRGPELIEEKIDSARKPLFFLLLIRSCRSAKISANNSFLSSTNPQKKEDKSKRVGIPEKNIFFTHPYRLVLEVVRSKFRLDYYFQIERLFRMLAVALETLLNSLI